MVDLDAYLRIGLKWTLENIRQEADRWFQQELKDCNRVQVKRQKRYNNVPESFHSGQ